MFKFLTHLENRNFLRLFLAQTISQFGDRIYQMALIGLIAERTSGSAVELAKLLSFTIIPVFIVGPIAGVYVDRWDRKKTLFVCDFLRGLLVLTIPFVFMKQESFVPIYVVVFLVFCLSRFYVPAKMSIIPDLVEDKNLLMANSLITTTGMIAFVLGCVSGGFIVDKVGARGGFICDAVAFFVSGTLVFSINLSLNFKMSRRVIAEKSREMIEQIQRTISQELKEGFFYLSRHKEIRFIINMLFILLSAAGAVYVVIIVFIQQTFNTVTRDLGLLAVFLGIGLFLGVLMQGKWGKRVVWYKTIFFCLMAGGMMMILFATIVNHYPNIFLASALALVMGLVIAPVFIVANTVVHQVCEEQMRGKVFSALEIVIHFAFLVSMLISSFLSEHISSFLILVGVGMIFFLVGVVGMIRFSRSGELAIPS